MPLDESRLKPESAPRHARHWRWTVPLLAVLPTLVLMTPMAAGPGAATTPRTLVGAKSLAKRQFVGTVTVTEHQVWNYSSSWVAEHGQRNITGQVKLDLVVSGTKVVSFKATMVTVNGSMHLLEQIHPSHCDITTTHKLDTKGAFLASGSLSDLALSWPMVDHQVDVGPCPGEPQGTNDFQVRWGSGAPSGLATGDCTTSDNGANGIVVYDSTYKPPFGTGGVGSATTDTCKGKLKKQPGSLGA